MNEVARKEIQFEADKKQAVTHAELQRQKIIRYSVMSGSGLALCSGVIFFIGYRKRRNNREIQQELLYKAALSENEMRVLRLQMNPHFIFNSLNSISDYIAKNDIVSADYFLGKFAKLMRGILENSEEHEIPLADELAMLESYMQLEAMRLKQKFTYEIRVADDLDPANILIPPLILQPFVENSIWHAMAKSENGKILISAALKDNMLASSSKTTVPAYKPHCPEMENLTG